MILAIQGVAALMGSAILAPLSDRYGRKRIITISLVSMVVFGVPSCFMPDVWSYALMSSLTQFSSAGIPSLVVTFAIELFPTEYRTLAGMGHQYAWVFIIATVPLISFLTPNWRWMKFTTYILLIPMIACLKFLPESLTWLISTRRMRTVHRWMLLAAKVNGVDCTEHPLRRCRHSVSQRRRISSRTDPVKHKKSHDDYGPKDSTIPILDEMEEKRIVAISYRNKSSDDDVFWNEKQTGTLKVFSRICTHPKLRLHTCVMFVVWCINHLVYSGSILTAMSFGGNIHLSTLLNVVVELPSYLVCYILMFRFGRRTVTCTFHMMCGVFLLGIIYNLFVSDSDKNRYQYVSQCLFLMGKFSITAAFAAIIIYTPETFPTTIRGVGTGFCSMGTKIISMVLPFISISLMKVDPAYPSLTFSICSIVAGLLILILPETLGRQLPHTIEDIDKLSPHFTEEERQVARRVYRHEMKLLRENFCCQCARK